MGKFSEKLYPMLVSVVTEVERLSWVGLIVILCISGVLIMFGNEYGGKKFCKGGVYGYLLIQLASMLL